MDIDMANTLQSMIHYMTDYHTLTLKFPTTDGFGPWWIRAFWLDRAYRLNNWIDVCEFIKAVNTDQPQNIYRFLE